MFQGLWIVPVYLLSFIINTFEFANIAEISRPSRGNSGDLMHIITEKLGSTGIKIFLTLQMVVVAQIPYLGWFISFVFASWYWAYACFEYVNCNKLSYSMELMLVL